MKAARILAVEDNEITRKLLRVTLETAGYSVAVAGDARSALREAAARPPDLILQDIGLPDMSGFDLVGRLRALPGGAAVSVVACTGVAMDVRTSSTSLFDAVLLKPVEPQALLQAVER